MKNSRKKLLTAQICVLLVLISSFFTLNIVSAAPATSILINEVAYDPLGEENEAEWFELYNPTFDPIDIGGWQIKEGATPVYTFPAETILFPDDHLLVANDTTEFQMDYPAITPYIETNLSSSLIKR